MISIPRNSHSIGDMNYVFTSTELGGDESNESLSNLVATPTIISVIIRFRGSGSASSGRCNENDDPDDGEDDAESISTATENIWAINH